MKQIRTEADLSALGRWMRENRHTAKTFAELIRIERKLKVFSSRTVEHWMYRQKTTPRDENLRAIKAVTDGAVTADSFVEGN